MSDFDRDQEPELVTVEYERLKTGITADGVVKFWDGVVEPFRHGVYAEPRYRAHLRATLLSSSVDVRSVKVTRWDAFDAQSYRGKEVL